MAQKRARLSDNDPLTATDAVLAGFEVLSKSGSQQVDKPASQEAEPASSELVAPASEVNDQSGSQQVDKLESQEVEKSTRQPANKPKEKLATQQADGSASQQVDKPVIKKATFQLNAAVLEELDRFHLRLQLEQGKANTPYKEVIVEEAIAQWLAQAEKTPDKALKGLQKRQSGRS